MINTYGSRLAKALLIANKSRQELADNLKVSVQAIGQVINGNTNAFTAENTALAARFLGVDVFWLATGLGDPKSVTIPSTKWPFSTDIELVLAIPQDERRPLDEYVDFFVSKWHTKNKSLKAS